MGARILDQRLPGDDIRLGDPDGAFQEYWRQDPQVLAEDPTRVSWMIKNLRTCPPKEAISFLEYVSHHGEFESQRKALHLLGVHNYFHGNTDAAEAIWQRALLAGREYRDPLRLQAQINLAVSLSVRGRIFESLVLYGGAARIAKETGRPDKEASALNRRAHLLIRIGDLERAEESLNSIKALSDEIDRKEVYYQVESVRLHALARLALANGQPLEALVMIAQEWDCLSRVDVVQPAVFAHCETRRLLAQYEAYPDLREQVIEEVEALEQVYELNDRWRDVWRGELVQLQLQRGRERDSNKEELIALAQESFELLQRTLNGFELARRAVELGQWFEEWGAVEDSKRAFDLTATEISHRLIEADLTTEELPELLEATEEDWKILNDYRVRLQTERAEVLNLVAHLWKPGHPAFDLVVNEDLIRICAWCHRIWTKTGRWLPIADYLPADEELTFTHTICNDCSTRHFG